MENKEEILWGNLKNKSILITGASGLIGSRLIEKIIEKNRELKANIKIFALGRVRKKIEDKIGQYSKNKSFEIIEHDIVLPFCLKEEIDYVIHAASNADPMKFSLDPTGTMEANFIGMRNILNLFKGKKTKILYISTGEIYGECDGNVEAFDEEYIGKINLLDARSCYPMSKRATETLCISYIKQFQTNVVIARPCHIYGATLQHDDSRFFAQVLRNILNKEDIILKSTGEQKRSYCYVDDAVMALFYILIFGEVGQAYNISNKNSNLKIKEVAELLSKMYKLDLKYEIPEEKEKEGYSKIQQAVLNSKKLEKLGWQAKISFEDGIKKCIDMLQK
ncbi:MAG: NAD-dependent epimerase/dehydratase family protein [Cetobacterium sp.]